MKAFLIVSISAFLLAGCALGPTAENTSGLEVTVKSLKNHSEGLDMSVDIHNTTHQLMGLSEQGSVSVLLDGSYRVRARLPEGVEIQPGETTNVKMEFEFINQPRIYKSGLLEILPNKMFKNCAAAENDPDVVQKKVKAEVRDVSSEVVESLTCDRPLKKAIRVGF